MPSLRYEITWSISEWRSDEGGDHVVETDSLRKSVAVKAPSFNIPQSSRAATPDSNP